MKGLLRLFVPILVSLFLFSISSCTPTPTSTTPAAITITDQAGRAVTLDSIPQRIMSIAPANTEILFALGLGDRIVGVTDYCNYPAEAKEKTSIGGFSSPNLEKIISLSPDIVFAAPIHTKQVIPQLESKGIKVIALTPTTLDEVMNAVTLIGKATGAEKQAADLINSMTKRIKTVTDKTAKIAVADKPKVLYLVWHDPLKASGQATFQDELIKKAGGVNMVAMEAYPTISLETVVAGNPDIIMAGVGMGQGADAPLVFAKDEPRLSDVNARVNNRIYGINSDVSGRAGPRIVDALEEFARMIHPELFK